MRSDGNERKQKWGNEICCYLYDTMSIYEISFDSQHAASTALHLL